MKTVITQTNIENQTMTSLDFLNDFINPARLAAGENEIRNRDFLNRVMDECDIDETKLSRRLENRNWQQYVDLDHDQMMMVGMRESKAVRRAVLAKLKEYRQALEDIQQATSLEQAKEISARALAINEFAKANREGNQRAGHYAIKALRDCKTVDEGIQTLAELSANLSNIKSYNDREHFWVCMAKNVKRVRDEYRMGKDFNAIHWVDMERMEHYVTKRIKAIRTKAA